jgi:hypothetical protein
MVSSNATASYCTSIVNNVIQRTNANVVPANVGVYVTGTGTYFDVIATPSSSDNATSILTPVLTDTNVPASSNGLYNYYNSGSLFLKMSNSTIIKANNAYLSTNINTTYLTLQN